MEIDENDFKQLLGLMKQLVEQNAEKSVKQECFPENDEDATDQFDEKITKKTRGPVVKKGKSPKFENKFLSMKESSMHKGDTAIDKKLNISPPTQRSRKFEYIDVKCRVCGKSEKISPALAESRDRYKCNRCSASPG